MRRLLGIALIAGVMGCLSFINNDEALEASIQKIDEVKGIQFQTLTLEAAKAKALETGKLIFIDVHASWCGPCKMMARGPFKDEKVGKIYNDNFINLKIDAEKNVTKTSKSIILKSITLFKKKG